MDSEKPKEPELKFCRLCGKNKAAEAIEKIVLIKIGPNAIVYDGCHSCAIVIHNASLIVGETLQREAKKIIKPAELQRIILPGFIPPGDLRGGG